MPYDPQWSFPVNAGLEAVRKMHLIDSDKDERREQITFRRLTAEQESFQVMRLSLAEVFFRSTGQTVSEADTRALMARLADHGYGLRRV